MINEKYKQLFLALQFGGINTIEYTKTLGKIRKYGFEDIKTK